MIKKVAQFNYFLLYDKIPHRFNLWKWKKSESSLCDMCKCLDDCKHFIFECIYVKRFWGDVVEKINRMFNIIIKVLWEHILF